MYFAERVMSDNSHISLIFAITSIVTSDTAIRLHGCCFGNLADMIAEWNAFSQHPVEFAVLTNCSNATIMIAVMIFSQSAMIDAGKVCA